MPSTPEDTVNLLVAISSGDRSAESRLFTLVYQELHGLAHAAMRGEPRGHVLQTTALIHEAYLRLLPASDLSLQDRGHFLCLAARAMRRILVDEARRRRTVKRGKGAVPLSLEAVQAQVGIPVDTQRTFQDLEALDRALQRLEARDDCERMCQIVDLLFFVGLTQEEAAKILGVSKGTVRRDWDFAKVWLQQEIRGDDDDGT